MTTRERALITTPSNCGSPMTRDPPFRPIPCRAEIGEPGTPKWCGLPSRWVRGINEGYCDMHGNRRHYAHDWREVPT